MELLFPFPAPNALDHCQSLKSQCHFDDISMSCLEIGRTVPFFDATRTGTTLLSSNWDSFKFIQPLFVKKNSFILISQTTPYMIDRQLFDTLYSYYIDPIGIVYFCFEIFNGITGSYWRNRPDSPELKINLLRFLQTSNLQSPLDSQNFQQLITEDEEVLCWRCQWGLLLWKSAVESELSEIYVHCFWVILFKDWT